MLLKFRSVMTHRLGMNGRKIVVLLYCPHLQLNLNNASNSVSVVSYTRVDVNNLFCCIL